MEENRYKKLASNTVLFAISSFSGKLLTLFIQPFITYAMREVEEVGITKLTSQCANLLIPLVGLGISARAVAALVRALTGAEGAAGDPRAPRGGRLTCHRACARGDDPRAPHWSQP